MVLKNIQKRLLCTTYSNVVPGWLLRLQFFFLFLYPLRIQ